MVKSKKAMKGVTILRSFNYGVLILIVLLTAGCGSEEAKLKSNDINRWVIEQDGTITDHNGKSLKGFNLFDPVSKDDGQLLSDIKQLYESYQAVYGEKQVPLPQPFEEEPVHPSATGITLDEFKNYHIDIDSGDIENNNGLVTRNFNVLDSQGRVGVQGFFAQIRLMYVARESIKASEQNVRFIQNQDVITKQSEPIVHRISDRFQLNNGLLLTIMAIQFDENNIATFTVKVENQMNENKSFTGHFGYQSSTQEQLIQFDLIENVGDILPGKTIEVAYRSKNSIKDKDIQALTLDTRSIKEVMRNPTLPYEYLITNK